VLSRLPRDPTSQLALIVGAWAVTRFLVCVVTLARESIYPAQDNAFEMVLHEIWGPAFARGEGEVPLRDTPWEYPAGAAVIIAFPALLRGAPYALTFVGVQLLVDLALLLLLVCWGLRRGSLAGAWFWIVAVPLLGPVVLGRFDLVPTLFAAAGLVAAAGAAPITAGVLLATGAVVKLWPALLVPIVLALHRGGLRVLAGGVAIGLLVLALVARFADLDHLLSFLGYQQDRRLEVESVLALPLMAQRLSGRTDITVGFGFGSFQVEGPGADLLIRIGDVGLVAVLVLVAALTWRLRRSAADRGHATVVLAVVLIAGFLIFNKVLSPQYPVWLMGLVALGLCWRGSPLRDLVLPLSGALLLTQLVYPMRFQDLLAGEHWPVRLLAARDALLVLVFLQATWIAWRLGRADSADTADPADTSEDEVPVDVEDRQQAQPAG
jgi:hypothetical protein